MNIEQKVMTLKELRKLHSYLLGVRGSKTEEIKIQVCDKIEQILKTL